MTGNKLTKVEENVFTIERNFNAPAEIVFKVSSDSEHVKHWFGPQGWALTVSKLDFRVGGSWHYCMKCEDPNQGDFYGMESWGLAEYREIIQNEKIVYVDYFSDADGNRSTELPSSETTMLFQSVNGHTKLTSITRYDTEEALKTVIDMGMEQGITETWDRLEEYVNSLQ